MSDRLAELRAGSAVADFRGFRCWSEGEVGEIMHREAAAPSRAVLLATHQPPQIRRVRVTDAGRFGTEDVIEQDELLERVKSSDDQALIIPIIGAAGSGKSHLVLWLQARLEDEVAPNRKIIYLPKGETRLDRVIELILDGRTGAPFDEIRQTVAAATRAMSLDEAARRLRDELSVALRKVDIPTGGTELEQMRHHARDNLPDLLDDPVYSKRLVGSGGPLRRIVEHATRGGNEEPAEIKPDDLDVELTAVELEDLSKPAKMLLGDLHSSPELHSAAVGLLNEVRDQCLSRIFGVEPTQLLAVVGELRKRLYEENPALELILMIEDFTLLQGIQHDLLEAMIELPRRGGEQVMCAMKTVMAVTDGFFTQVLASSDTLRTRVAAQGHVYNLDVAYGDEAGSGVDSGAVVDFAGRYLNAVRLGAQHLGESAPVVDNACDVCAHRDVCHEAFGTGDSEYGLYPFNEVALDRMVRSRQATFSPRDLLAVMATTLTTHAQELHDGRFPSRRWARDFEPRQFGRPVLETLSLGVQQQVEQTPKHEQRGVLLTFWGGVPAEFKNLPKGIHEAFDIPILAEAKTVVPAIPAPKPGPTPPESTGNRFEQACLAWTHGERLESDYARIIRRVLHGAILGAFDAADALIANQALSQFDQSTDIIIKNSAGSSRPAPGRFRVELAPSNDNGILFAGILKMSERGSWDFDGGAETLVNLLTLVDAETARLRAFVNDRIAEQEADRSTAVALLLLSGLIAGKGGTSDTETLLSAAVDVSEPRPVEAMPGLWRTLVTMTARDRPVVREFALQTAHVSKDRNDPVGIDGMQITEPLRAFAKDWELPGLSDAAPRPVTRLRELLDTRLAPAFDEAHEELTAWHAEIVALVGDVDSASARYKTWRAALDDAHAEGLLVRDRAFDSDEAPVPLGDLVRTVGRILERWPELDTGQRAARVAAAPWARLEPVRAHLAALEATLEASSEKAQTQQAVRGEVSPIAAFEDALARVESAVKFEVST